MSKRAICAAFSMDWPSLSCLPLKGTRRATFTVGRFAVDETTGACGAGAGMAGAFISTPVRVAADCAFSR